MQHLKRHLVTACAILATSQFALAGSSVGPDVIVGDLSGVSHHGPVSGVHAYAVGTTSCNIGDQILLWVAGTNQHPLIGQNIYRLKNGRIEQLGGSWLKHAFAVAPGNTCGTCTGSGGGMHPGCSDPYGTGLNASQSSLGPRSEVNPLTGAYPYPYVLNWQQTGDAVFKRVQVLDADVNPALNAGAIYFAEAQYITADDALAGNGYNNASYRRITLNSDSSFSLASTTQREKPAIMAWAEHGLGVNTPDPDVMLVSVDDPEGGRFWVGSKATNLGGGQWHYEYAVYNLNSDRAMRAFMVPRSGVDTISNQDFHRCTVHSDEPYSNNNWVPSVNPGDVKWGTGFFNANPNAAALRWGYTYNFRFDSDEAPVNTIGTMELFKPGAPNSIFVPLVAPEAADCNTNGTPDDQDVAGGGSADCNNDQIPDECQTAGNDCNTNGMPDDCELMPDCNTNRIPDICDAALADCDANGVPDACQSDCDEDGTIDVCEAGGLIDCDSNGVSDVCDPDCDTNGLPDVCDINAGDLEDCNNNGIPEVCETAGFFISATPNTPITDNAVTMTSIVATSASLVADIDVGINITHTWDSDVSIKLAHSGSTIFLSNRHGGSANNYTDTFFDDDAATPISAGSAPFTGTFRPDQPLSTFDGNVAGGSWDIILQDFVTGDQGTLTQWSIDVATPLIDCNNNGIPDDCEADCNTNGSPDECDISGGGSQDVDGNGIPDECPSAGCNTCVGDVNGDGIVDAGDIQSMVDCLLGGAPSCACADMDSDSDVDSDDVAMYVTAVIAGSSPCP